jgi:NarL family two-component system response regulator YdfI
VRENNLIHVLLDIPSPALKAGIRSLLSTDDQIMLIDEHNAWSDSLQEGQYEADVVITTSASFAAYQSDVGDDLSPPAILFLRNEVINIQHVKPAEQVWGILPLDASVAELCAAVHALSQGMIVGPRQLLFPVQDDENITRGTLTDRESEVLALLAKGLANKQIAMALGISEHTVKFHVSSIYTKLNATNRTQAVREGLRNGWIVL